MGRSFDSRSWNRENDEHNKPKGRSRSLDGRNRGNDEHNKLKGRSRSLGDLGELRRRHDEQEKEKTFLQEAHQDTKVLIGTFSGECKKPFENINKLVKAMNKILNDRGKMAFRRHMCTFDEGLEKSQKQYKERLSQIWTKSIKEAQTILQDQTLPHLEKMRELGAIIDQRKESMKKRHSQQMKMLSAYEKLLQDFFDTTNGKYRQLEKEMKDTIAVFNKKSEEYENAKSDANTKLGLEKRTKFVLGLYNASAKLDEMQQIAENTYFDLEEYKKLAVEIFCASDIAWEEYEQARDSELDGKYSSSPSEHVKHAPPSGNSGESREQSHPHDAQQDTTSDKYRQLKKEIEDIIAVFDKKLKEYENAKSDANIKLDLKKRRKFVLGLCNESAKLDEKLYEIQRIAGNTNFDLANYKESGVKIFCTSNIAWEEYEQARDSELDGKYSSSSREHVKHAPSGNSGESREQSHPHEAQQDTTNDKYSKLEKELQDISDTFDEKLKEYKNAKNTGIGLEQHREFGIDIHNIFMMFNEKLCEMQQIAGDAGFNLKKYEDLRSKIFDESEAAWKEYERRLYQ
jgi:hypothetical protein